jgi:hypothetical protein
MLAAVAVVGVTGAGTALAYTPPAQPNFLCVFYNGDEICAYAHASNPIGMTVPDDTTTNWYFPVGGVGDIEQANTDNCMQVDHAAGNTVIEAQCNEQNYQEWNVVDDVGATGYYQFQSEYAPSDCLSYNADGAELVIGGCGSTDEYQHFYPENLLIITP